MLYKAMAIQMRKSTENQVILTRLTGELGD